VLIAGEVHGDGVQIPGGLVCLLSHGRPDGLTDLVRWWVGGVMPAPQQAAGQFVDPPLVLGFQRQAADDSSR